MFFFFQLSSTESTQGRSTAQQGRCWPCRHTEKGQSLAEDQASPLHGHTALPGRREDAEGVAPISALLPKCCSTGLLTRPQHRAHSSTSLTSSYLLDKAVQDAVFCSIAEAAASCTSLLILFNRKKETGDQTIRARGSRMLESCS